MPFFKQPKPIRFVPGRPVEMHFHECDETWIIMGGKAIAHSIDRDGKKHDFEIEAGDIWMTEAGVQHGCTPIGEILIFPFLGTIPQGSTKKGHLYMEKERCMPTLVLKNEPLDR